MRRSLQSARFAAFVLLAAAVQTPALEVRLLIAGSSEINRPAPRRQASPVTTGVPFPKGTLPDPARLVLKAGGQVVPAQFITTVKWDDGSLRWVLVDFQTTLESGATNEVVLSDAGGNIPHPTPVTIRDSPAAVTVSTGPLQFTVNKQKFNLFESIRVDGKEQVTTAGRGLVLYTEDGKEVVAGNPTAVTVEQAGPLRAILCLKGHYPDAHKGLLAYTVRISAYAGRKAIKLQAWLENQDGMGYYRAGEDNPSAAINMEWFFFDGMALELGLNLGETVTAACEGVEAPTAFRIHQYCLQAKGQEKARHKRAPFYTWNDFEYTIASGTNTIKTGARTEGLIALKGSTGALTAGIGDFWQNYEKAIQLAAGKLHFWLWPREGQWPRAGIKEGNELYDRSLVNAQKDGGYNYVGAAHKGHTIILDFSGADPAAVAADLNSPLLALAPAAHYAASAAGFGALAPPNVRTGNSECDFKLGAWLRACRNSADPSSPVSVHESRRAIAKETLHSYGWMDFGDISVPGHGAVALHHDWLWTMLLQTLRSGDRNAFILAREMAAHRIDVDTLWSDLDLPETRGMQRGGPFVHFHTGRLRWIPGVSGNWMTGLALYYMLTGEPKALEACHRGAQGLRAGWEWVREAKPYGGPQGDMLANARSMAVFCELYMLTADKTWLADAERLFTENIAPKWKTHGPHLHSAEGQITGQDYIKEDQKYCFAIEYLCEYHRQTGNAEVLKLLKDGADKEFPGSFFDAPLYLSGLHAYVAAATGNKEYRVKATEAFINGFPESKSPPVYLPNNSTWSQQAPALLRSGQLLQYATWKLADTK